MASPDSVPGITSTMLPFTTTYRGETETIAVICLGSKTVCEEWAFDSLRSPMIHSWANYSQAINQMVITKRSDGKSHICCLTVDNSTLWISHPNWDSFKFHRWRSSSKIPNSKAPRLQRFENPGNDVAFKFNMLALMTTGSLPAESLQVERM